MSIIHSNILMVSALLITILLPIIDYNTLEIILLIPLMILIHGLGYYFFFYEMLKRRLRIYSLISISSITITLIFVLSFLTAPSIVEIVRFLDIDQHFTITTHGSQLSPYEFLILDFDDF